MTHSMRDLRVSWERRRELYEGDWPGTTIGDLLARNVAETPDATAITEIHPMPNRIPPEKRIDADVLTYAELEDRVQTYAAVLADLGVEPGDVVLIQLPAWWQWVAMVLASERIGTINATVICSRRRAELSHIVADVSPTVAVVPAEFRDFDFPSMMSDLRQEYDAPEHVLVVGDAPDDDRTYSLSTIASELEDTTHSTGPEPVERDPNDIVHVNYTSGTTGQPKGVLHTHNTLCSMPDTTVDRIDYRPDDVVHMGAPMGHMVGYQFGFLLPLYLGTRSVLQDVWVPAAFVEAVPEHGVTVTHGTTAFLRDVVDEVSESDAESVLDSFRIFQCGGETIPPEVVIESEATLGCRVYEVFGMTECGTQTLLGPDDPNEKRYRTAGRPVRGAQVDVRDRTGSSVVDEPGDLYTRGPTHAVGYTDLARGREKIDDECWLESGDRAVLDEDGYLTVVGRSKDIIIRGGENIAPREIEDILHDHPDVESIAVVAMPDERLGERPCAYVVVPTSGPTPTLEALTSFLEDAGLDRHKHPERLEVVDELPMTATGKIQKYRLRDRLESRESSGRD